MHDEWMSRLKSAIASGSNATAELKALISELEQSLEGGPPTEWHLHQTLSALFGIAETTMPNDSSAVNETATFVRARFKYWSNALASVLLDAAALAFRQGRNEDAPAISFVRHSRRWAVPSGPPFPRSCTK